MMQPEYALTVLGLLLTSRGTEVEEFAHRLRGPCRLRFP